MKSTAKSPLVIEKRYLPATELRAATTADGKRVISGYAAVFGTMSEDLGGFRETIRKGAFTATVEDGDIRALVDHEPSKILGRKKAGTLRLKEDEIGLYFEIDAPDTTAARDLIQSLDRGDVDGCSFGFRAIEDEWTMKEGVATRELIKVHCFDVSIVTYPAYTDTSVALRSLAEFRSTTTRSTTATDYPRLRRALALLGSD